MQSKKKWYNWNYLQNRSRLSDIENKPMICCCSVTKSCLTLCDPTDCSTPGSSVLHYLLEFAQIHVHRVNDAIQPSHPLSSPSPALSLSQHQGFFPQWVSSSHQVAKVLKLQLKSFQWIFRISFFWIDWFYLLAVQETLKSLLQRHNSKASVLQRSDFFMDQLSWLLGKNIPLTIWTFVGKVMFLLLNMLFEF